jgi:hypothetical protein
MKFNAILYSKKIICLLLTYALQLRYFEYIFYERTWLPFFTSKLYLYHKADYLFSQARKPNIDYYIDVSSLDSAVDALQQSRFFVPLRNVVDL